ncbi:hypothetical protein AXG93_107s1110 [Marchantia polymorpha subsp. ruderalis]|uniref:Uncharacterized protein n=1 Tax=Marchantia polymorpha subsp. ruderalis TaxID=1480154 RepID=A0A176WHK2_MARPO|nr:hypothetical protein AXG93_107s1110 [Marchantia polymorpha subsp. ruderalis]
MRMVAAECGSRAGVSEDGGREGQPRGTAPRQNLRGRRTCSLLSPPDARDHERKSAKAFNILPPTKKNRAREGTKSELLSTKRWKIEKSLARSKNQGSLDTGGSDARTARRPWGSAPSARPWGKESRATGRGLGRGRGRGRGTELDVGSDGGRGCSPWPRQLLGRRRRGGRRKIGAGEGTGDLGLEIGEAQSGGACGYTAAGAGAGAGLARRVACCICCCCRAVAVGQAAVATATAPAPASDGKHLCPQAIVEYSMSSTSIHALHCSPSVGRLKKKVPGPGLGLGLGLGLFGGYHCRASRESGEAERGGPLRG